MLICAYKLICAFSLTCFKVRMCKISDKSDAFSLNYSNLFRGPLFFGTQCRIRAGELYFSFEPLSMVMRLFPSTVTIWLWGRGTLWAINWRWRKAFPRNILHFNHCSRHLRMALNVVQKNATAVLDVVCHFLALNEKMHLFFMFECI